MHISMLSYLLPTDLQRGLLAVVSKEKCTQQENYPENYPENHQTRWFSQTTLVTTQGSYLPHVEIVRYTRDRARYVANETQKRAAVNSGPPELAP